MEGTPDRSRKGHMAPPAGSWGGGGGECGGWRIQSGKRNKGVLGVPPMPIKSLEGVHCSLGLCFPVSQVL